ncbi:MAG: winged helix-turn-helix transcriptional regulator [Nocardioides sp.]
MSETHWNFLSNHGRTLLCIAHDPGARLRDIAEAVSLTERRAHDIVTDLTSAGYVVKTKEGRRNHYTIQSHMPLRDDAASNRTIGELLRLLTGSEDQR